MWLQVTLYLCTVIFAGLYTVIVGSAQSVCYTRWDTEWYNDTHPTSDDDQEFLPNTTVLDDFCDPQQGSLVIRCSPDPEHYFWFHGYYETEDYTAECNSTFGLECYLLGDQPPDGQAGEDYLRPSYDCPDYAIQLGCEFCQASTPPPPCGTGTSGQHQNTGNHPNVAHGPIVFSLFILLFV